MHLVRRAQALATPRLAHARKRSISSISSSFSGHRDGGLLISRSRDGAIFQQRHRYSSSGGSSNDAAFRRTRIPRYYNVVEIRMDGSHIHTQMDVREVLGHFGLHARDIIELGLGDEAAHPSVALSISQPPVVLPRKRVIGVAMAHVKALIFKDRCLLFDAHRPSVALSVHALSTLIRKNMEDALEMETDPNRTFDFETAGMKGGGSGSSSSSSSSRGNSTGSGSKEGHGGGGVEPYHCCPSTFSSSSSGSSSSSSSSDVTLDIDISQGGGEESGIELPTRPPHPGNNNNNNNKSEAKPKELVIQHHEVVPWPFELAVLEAVVQEVVASYQRRARLFSKVVRSVLDQVTQQTHLGTQADFHKLAPIRAALKDCELKTEELRNCFADLLRSDEDMIALLLTEKERVGNNAIVEYEKHNMVELLLERYHRQLLISQHEVAVMMSELQGAQELAAINLDLFRNRMIRIEMQLTMLSIGVAMGGALYGAMGMNLMHGAEELPNAFGVAVGSGLGIVVVAYSGFILYWRSVANSKILDTHSIETVQFQSLLSLFSKVGAIEIVLREALRDKQQQALAAEGKGASASGGKGTLKKQESETEKTTTTTTTTTTTMGAGREREEKPSQRPSSSCSLSSSSSSSSSSASAPVVDREKMRKLLLQETGIACSDEELDMVFHLLDEDGDGFIERHESEHLDKEIVPRRGGAGGCET